MQDAQALIQQIDDLSKQNNSLNSELNDVKKVLQAMQGQSNGNSGGQGGSGQNGQGGQGYSSGQSGGSQSQQSGGQSGADPTAKLAGELKQLKGMVQSLETKMSNFVSNQSGSNQLNQADIVNLLLTVMDGMIDWCVDYVSSAPSGGQKQQLQ